jgi:hypothetical protein
MAFDVAIIGTLVLSRRDLDAWKKLVVDSSRWRAIARVFPSSPRLEPKPVGELLKELPQVGWHDRFAIERDGPVYRVRGRFAERPFRERCRQLAALFMTARDVDAQGDVYFLGEGVREGYWVQVPDGKPTLAALDDEEIERRTRDPELDALSGTFKLAPESTPRPAGTSPPVEPSPPGTGRALLRLPPDRSD